MTHSLHYEEKSKPIYNELRRQILSLELPPGTLLHSKELAERFGVSITPVREALLGLRQDALIDIHPQSRTSVSRISLTSLQSAYFLRLALETEVIVALAQSANPDNLALARATVDRHAEASFRGLDDACREAGRAFHAALFQAAGCGRLSKLAARSSHPLKRIDPLLDRPVEDEVVETHNDILRHIQCGDRDRASDIMRFHINLTTNGVAAVAHRFPQYFAS